MKITKCALPFLLCSSLVLSGCGCGNVKKTEVEKVIISELDLLKNLDSDTTQKYISYQELFPDTEDEETNSSQIEEVFSLFFRDFDYKILDIEVDSDTDSATASIRLTTIDANTLAKDFAAARLQEEILADTLEEEAAAPVTLESNYLLLDQVLKSKNYEKVENNCTMVLKEKDDTWEIQRTQTLENQLVGGLLTYLSNPDILSPQETVQIYLDTLKNMDDNQLCTYLGINDLLESEDSARKELASAIAQQIHQNFSYEIKDSQENGYSASVNVAITTFDAEEILDRHNALLEEYLASPDAVIDGSAKRLEKSRQLLVETIRANTAVVTSEISINLMNNGASWEIAMDENQLGKALFGSLEENLSDS